MFSEEENITSRFRQPVMPSAPGGATPSFSRMESTRLSGSSTWEAKVASSFSHQPQRVKVSSVSLPSTLMGRVNCAPSSGSTPSSSSTRVSAAASSVPSAGSRPVVGARNIQSASFSSAQLTSTWSFVKASPSAMPKKRRRPHSFTSGSAENCRACSSVMYLKPPWA